MTGKVIRKKDFIRLLTKKTGYRMADMREILNTIVYLMEDIAINEDVLDVVGFGKMYTIVLPEKEIWREPGKSGLRKPGIGEKIICPPSKKLVFKLSDNLRKIYAKGRVEREGFEDYYDYEGEESNEEEEW